MYPIITGYKKLLNLIGEIYWFQAWFYAPVLVVILTMKFVKSNSVFKLTYLKLLKFIFWIKFMVSEEKSYQMMQYLPSKYVRQNKCKCLFFILIVPINHNWQIFHSLYFLHHSGSSKLINKNMIMHFPIISNMEIFLSP